MHSGDSKKGDHNPRLATADHIVPKSMGGPGHLHNFVLACRGCNEKRGDNLYYCRCSFCKTAITGFFNYMFSGVVIGPVKPRVWKHAGRWVTSYGLNSYSWPSWHSAMRAVPSPEKANA